MADVIDSAAYGRVREMLDRPATTVDGYLDVLGAERVPQTTAQRLMGSRLLPAIYESLWRPLAFFAFTMRNAAEEDRLKRRLLDVGPGDVVLDLACGPGNTSRSIVEDVGDDGLVVGADSSATMLEQAVRDTPAHRPLAYVRADAVDLPFASGTFDAVSCYGALYLMDDPFGALEEMVRVLKPGGRIAVLTTCARGPAHLRRLTVAASGLAPLRVFDVHEVTMALRAAGLEHVTRQVTAASQTVGGRKPAG